MYTTTPPVAELNRLRLRQVAAWIRDELDPVIAREGPEMLRADDVLTLHEIFHSLRVSHTITALDLRATGIHRAVMEVAGKATRWPGRLADDCDRIIMVWKRKFGPLQDLRPYIYGRAGRLEGIANAIEFSKASLLQRWQRTCPDRIAPYQSHRNGDLGFRAGAWWLNPLFAHHAGIIDLDSTEGGICYDKYGAYALLMKDIGEIEASSERTFTYRCSQDDKGRFRLTSAVPRSRRPIRILRSHTLNSIWGPKAGVRYEGLYRVKGWTIRPVKNKSLGGTEHKINDMIYEVEFERDDPVSMKEVMRHPTKFELDDYAEYKRLQRIHHGGPQMPMAVTSRTDAPAKAAPPIQPLIASISQLRALSMSKRSPSPNVTRKHPLATVQGSPGPLTSSSTKHVGVPEVESYFGLPKSTLEAPTATSMRSGTFFHRVVPTDKNDSPKSEGSVKASASSILTHCSNLEEMREVAPWLDLDPMLAAPMMSPLGLPGATQSTEHDVMHIPSPKVSTLKSQTTSKDHSLSAAGSPGGRQRTAPSPGGTGRKKSKSNWEPNLTLIPRLSKTRTEKKKDPGKLMSNLLARNKSPPAKLFDGTCTDGAEEKEYFSFKNVGQRRASLPNAEPKRTVPRHHRSSSLEATAKPLSPIPPCSMTPLSPLISRRRDAICLPFGFGYVVTANPFEDQNPDLWSRPSTTSSLHDPFIDDAAFVVSTATPTRTKSPRALPMSLKDFISKPTIATPISVNPALRTRVNVSPMIETLSDVVSGEAGIRRGGLQWQDSAAGQKLRSIFKDPFQEDREKCKEIREKKGSEGVEDLAPDACT